MYVVLARHNYLLCRVLELRPDCTQELEYLLIIHIRSLAESLFDNVQGQQAANRLSECGGLSLTVSVLSCS